MTGLVISAETLAAGATQTLEYVLHEAAHVLCWVRGVQDTATWGAYHNGTYLEAATEVGLTWPADRARSETKGFAGPELSPEALRRHAADLTTLEAAIPLVLPHLVIPDAPPKRRPAARLTLLCGCDEPRRIQVSPTVASKGPIICGVCEEPFTTS
ncbi:hypothetical protein [Streptomyces sp. NPDC057509]|uniref:hypothetical protein n=1 Tax=Streptomyces sp. NPDC057509 TaxID=3346152 RepID=UPI00368C39AB